MIVPNFAEVNVANLAGIDSLSFGKVGCDVLTVKPAATQSLLRSVLIVIAMTLSGIVIIGSLMSARTIFVRFGANCEADRFLQP